MEFRYNILREKAAQGVEVLLLYDDVGCIQTLPPGYDQTLKELGLQVTVFNPYRPHLNMVMNYRDHRKICVVDGNIGFCGGINLADEYINAFEKHGHWKDTAVRLEGDGGVEPDPDVPEPVAVQQPPGATGFFPVCAHPFLYRRGPALSNPLGTAPWTA